MAAITVHRRALPFRTLFNVIGPLINPSRPKGMVLGIAKPELGISFAQTLQKLGVKRALVVCGAEHLDEISIAGPTFTWSFDDPNGDVKEAIIQPEDFGVQSHPLSEVLGSSAADNAIVLRRLLTPNGKDPLPSTFNSSLEAIQDFILINAAALLFIAGVAESYPHGVVLARQSLSNGKAMEALDSFKAGEHATT
jgi:anthranilate phosphoribosyltransferase